MRLGRVDEVESVHSRGSTCQLSNEKTDVLNTARKTQKRFSRMLGRMLHNPWMTMRDVEYVLP